jgi:hypothetical protein
MAEHQNTLDEFDEESGRGFIGVENTQGRKSLISAQQPDAVGKFANLFPEDYPKPVKRSMLEIRDGKWVEVRKGDEVRSASGTYNFTTIDGKIYAGKLRGGRERVGHIDISRGENVDYAGTASFSGRYNRGILRSWSNESGHYKPASEFSSQAGFPEELFQQGKFYYYP